MSTDIYHHSPLNEVDMEMWERKFHKFMSPLELKAQYDRLFSIVGTLEFFVKAGLTFMKDAYISAKFGNITDVEKVRLVPTKYNENHCEVIHSGRHSVYQVVRLFEVDPKLREAIKSRQPIAFQPLTEEKMNRNLYNGVDRIEQALLEKTKTSKTENAKLVIHFNVSELIEDSLFTTLVRDRLKTTKHNFSLVNIIRQGKIYRFESSFDDFTIYHNRNKFF